LANLPHILIFKTYGQHLIETYFPKGAENTFFDKLLFHITSLLQEIGK
jgi:hypothetical protein